MSNPAIACMFLLWQQPTDRALAGWCPEPGWRAVNEWPEKEAVEWLRDQIAYGCEVEDEPE